MSRRVFLCLLSATSAFILLALAISVRAQDDATPTNVLLIIDYGSGVEKHWNRIEWSDGITVLGAMEHASNLPEPLGLRFEVRGKGAMAFVRSIDGLDNEGSGRGKRNWTFRVNGELATQSCGALELEADDVVRWTFAAYNVDENNEK